MSTEAKIKPVDLEAVEASLLACDGIRPSVTGCMLAELRRNRRLLEAGERLAEELTKECDHHHTYVPIPCVRQWLAAYQEAAK